VCDLIWGEYRLREGLGETPALDEFERRFPHLTEALRQHFAGGTIREPVRAPNWKAPTEPLETDTVVPLPPTWPVLRGYDILRELGRGGMGVVYLAQDVRLKRLVALKLVLAGPRADSENAARFRAEAEAVARLHHPHIVQIYEIGEHAGQQYISFEYVDGGTLEDKLNGLPQPTVAAAEFVETLARAVHYAHQKGIVHRDLKPANILLAAEARRETQIEEKNQAQAIDPTPNGGTVRSPPICVSLRASAAKIADFGLARPLDADARLTRTGTIMGTPGYMAPEQAAGDPRQIGPAVDIYALGAILYEMLTGEVLFPGASFLETLERVRNEEPMPPRRVQPRIPRDLETICLKCLQKEPRRRYLSAHALAEDLRRFRAGEPILARPVGPLERTWRWCRRKPVLAALSAALVLAVTGGFTGVTLKWREAEQQRAYAEYAQLVAEEKQQQADTARREVQQFSARLVLERGLNLCKQSELGPGLLWLARGLELVPADDAELQQALRSLLGGWSAPLHSQRAVFLHEKHVLQVAFSPDGQVVATACSDGTAWLWKGGPHTQPGLLRGEVEVPTLGQPLTPPLRHGGEITALAFSPDGRRVATASALGTARLWDVATGSPIGSPLVHQDKVLAIAFSPLGDTLVTASADRTARLWDAVTGQPRGIVLRHEGRVRTVAFSPDGKWIATGGGDWTVRLWQAQSGSSVCAPLRHEGEVRKVLFSSDGQTVLSGGNDGTARLWDAATGKPRCPPLPHPRSIGALAMSPDGKLVLTGCDDKAARLWETSTGNHRSPSLLHQGHVNVVAFSPDGQTVLTGSDDGTVQLWDTATGRLLGQALRHQDDVTAAAFSPDGRLVLTGAEDGTARLWAIGTGRPVGQPVGAQQPHVRAAVFRPDGQVFLSASRTARLCDLATGRVLMEVTHPQEGIGAVALSPDGRLAATGGYDRTARLWDLASGKPLGEPLLHPAPSWIHAVAFSPDGTRLLTASGDFESRMHRGEARLWDLATRQVVVEFRGHEREVEAAVFSPDGRSIITGSRDRTVRVWDAATGQQRGRSLRHADWVTAVAVSPDGRTLLTGCHDSCAWLWDLATGQMVGEPLRHSSDVDAVAFSPDGRTLVTGGTDGTVRLWDALTRKPLGEPLRHAKEVLGVTFRPDGGAVLSSCKDGFARLWPVPGALTGEAERIRLWLQVNTGTTLDAGGGLLFLDKAGWQNQLHRLQGGE
jgi:WD40 repeat protein/serine/threonine protein kinase